MQAVTNVREDAEDVYADAKDINERRAAEEDAEVIEDASEEKRTRNKSQESRDARLSFTFGGIDTL